MRKYCVFLVGIIIGLVSVDCQPKQQQDYGSMPEELAKIYKEIEKNPKDANLYIQLSKYFIHSKQLDSALNNALTAIRLDSANSTIYVAVSDVYFSMGNIDATEEMLEKAIALDKNNNNAYLKLGELYFLLRDYKSSKNILMKAIEQEKHNPRDRKSVV